LLFLQYNFYLFAAQMIFYWCAGKKIECALQTFVPSLSPYGVSFCHLMERVLPPYVKFLKRSTKDCCIFLGGGGVKASQWIACCCQKVRFESEALEYTFFLIHLKVESTDFKN
jgi:hypothetical protein